MAITTAKQMEGYIESSRDIVQKVKSGLNMDAKLVAWARKILMTSDGVDPLPNLPAAETPAAETPPPPKSEEIASLLAKARGLKLDVVAIGAYAHANGIDGTECLKAAIATEEQQIKDNVVFGTLGISPAPAQKPAQDKPVDSQLEADRKIAAAFGVVI